MRVPVKTIMNVASKYAFPILTGVAATATAIADKQKEKKIDELIKEVEKMTNRKH